MFKNGRQHLALFPSEESLSDPSSLINWLSSVDVVDIAGAIERVSAGMLRNVVASEDDVLVFFYDEVRFAV